MLRLRRLRLARGGVLICGQDLGSSVEACSGHADSSMPFLASLICGAVTICTMCHTHNQASISSKQCPSPSHIPFSQTQTS